MDILSFDDKLNKDVCDPLLIYTEKNKGCSKSNMLYQSTHWTVNDHTLITQFYRNFRNSYRHQFLSIIKDSRCNYLSIIKFNKHNFINSWMFFDQIVGKPSTLTFVAKIVESEQPVSLEFIRDGKVNINSYSIVIFPSCFTYSFRINPIQSESDCIVIGSVLVDK